MSWKGWNTCEFTEIIVCIALNALLCRILYNLGGRRRGPRSVHSQEEFSVTLHKYHPWKVVQQLLTVFVANTVFSTILIILILQICDTHCNLLTWFMYLLAFVCAHQRFKVAKG